ncbi:MAG: hypothetical protein ACKVQS_07860 [Fimbriimonadaceae bacterium]
MEAHGSVLIHRRWFGWVLGKNIAKGEKECGLPRLGILLEEMYRYLPLTSMVTWSWATL